MQNLLFTKKIYKYSATFLLASAVALLAGCGDGGTVPITGVNSTGVASLQLSASSSTVRSDNSSTTTITVTALNAGNALLPDTLITLSADTGNLSSGTAITDSTGKATLTFSSGTSSKANRIATITASIGTISAQLPLQIVGSSIAVTPSMATLADDGSLPLTMLITVMDAGGKVVPNTAVTLSTGGSGSVALSALSGTTNASGQLSVVATGNAGGIGTVTVGIAALGATATSTLTVSPAAATFAIDQQTLNGTVIANSTLTAMNIGDSLVVRVNAPAPMADVTFVTSTGDWNGLIGPRTVAAVAGKATATLTTTQAGVANVQVYDATNISTMDTLTVPMTAPAAAASSITVNASPALISKSTSTSSAYSTLTASVKDVNGYPVGGAAVAFTIINPTGGGETVSPVVGISAMTTSGGIAAGDVRTTFTSGTLSSPAAGVQVRASIVGNAAVNGVTSIVISGTAASITFGQATVLQEDASLANYILPMSVIVADISGNPAPLGTPVTLSVWPIAWSTGSGCLNDPDTATSGIFLNEDANENVFLDPLEDGKRVNSLGSQPGGFVNGLLTPPNSAAGTVPGTVYTDAYGVAAFSLTYPKSSAIWIIDRIRARTTVQGSEAVGEVSFRLDGLKKDITPDCLLPASPYNF